VTTSPYASNLLLLQDIGERFEADAVLSNKL